MNYFCSFLISLGCIYSIRTSGSSSVHSHVPRTLIVMGAQTSSCHLLPKTAAINNLHTRQEGRVTISFVYTPKQDCWVIRTSCCCCSVAKWCPILCDSMDCSTPGFPVCAHLIGVATTTRLLFGTAVLFSLLPTAGESVLHRYSPINTGRDSIFYTSPTIDVTFFFLAFL